MPRGKAIMVQGTGSHVGKSLLATALCRILRQDGYRVAPFKAQNMSNNAAVCADGGEIGRAQAEQAAACGIEPTTAMNPILLKPCTDTGSQVVVMGRATATLTAKEYQVHKVSLLPKVQAAIDSLLEDNEVVVIEGAGSPAEINLKQHDLVNMRTAAMADAAVLLVGDIDKGGVFAQLVGTFELLDDDERRRVRGLIINKFRGDLDILRPGLDFIEKRLERPVLGVVPYLHRLRIAEEDTIPEELLRRSPRALRIDVIRHPRIANFTDFDALGDTVRYVSEPPDDLPDAVIVPGTKSTVADLRHLREAGFEAWIRGAQQAGVEIVGICGGFQMLGRTIVDPHHAESQEDAFDGLGLLDCHTVFQTVKETARVKGVHVASGAAIEGYEIHAGCTQGNPGPRPLFRITERHGMAAEGYDGVASPDGRVWGTYLHGVFDGDGFRRWWLERLQARVCNDNSVGNAILGFPRHTDGSAVAGSRNATVSVPYRKRVNDEDRFDRLAAAVRQAIDVDHLYRIIFG